MHSRGFFALGRQRSWRRIDRDAPTGTDRTARGRRLAGEPARLGELKRRFQRHRADDGFAAFVGRQAVLALARAERELVGLQYKVPRLVVEELEASARFRERLAALAASLDKPVQQVAR